MRVPTIYVNRNGNKVKINKSKFNPAIDEQWQDEPVTKAPDTDDAEKEKLIADLAELGIKKTKRSSVESLRADLDEALNKPAEE